MNKEKINNFYNKNYKLILLIPIIILVLALFSIGHFYIMHHDILNRDISLTGGTSISVISSVPYTDVQRALVEKIPDLETRSLSDNTGKQKQVVLLTSKTPAEVIPIIEEYFGFKLDEKNSSVEFIGSSLSANFYKQLGVAVAIAFFWMAAVVFIIFSKKWSIKILAILLNLLFGIFLGKIFFALNLSLAIPILFIFIAILLFVYIKYSIPSFAVMFCAFADIIMTLAFIDLIGMKISGAGIVAFLMLIGYSVDTDILLTTRVLTRKNSSVNREIFGAFKTGITMTLTAIAAVAVALFFIRPFGTVLNQMFIILLIGLSFDILNTWVTNTSLIKWFVESKEKSSDRRL